MAGRIATCDLGSNSLLLLVVEVGDDGELVRLDERLALTRIGRGVGATGRFDPAAEAATLDALSQFVAAASALDAGPIQCVATAGLRDAHPAERERLLAAAADRGVDIKVIDGDREADLTALAVVCSLPDVGDDLWMVDVGGRSTEIVAIRGGKAVRTSSLSLGGVGLTETLLSQDPPGSARVEAARSHAADMLCRLNLDGDGDGDEAGLPVVAAGGTATTLAAVLHRIDPYDADRVHGIRLPLSDLSKGIDLLADLPLVDLLRMPGLVPGRADIAVGGAVALEAAVRHLGAASFVVSDRGLRWGLAYEMAGRR